MILLSFQRQKLEAVEEENRRQAKTVQGKHLSCGFCCFYPTHGHCYIGCCVSSSELEQSVEQSKKDYQILKEEKEGREKELTQVGLHSKSEKHFLMYEKLHKIMHGLSNRCTTSRRL